MCKETHGKLSMMDASSEKAVQEIEHKQNKS